MGAGTENLRSPRTYQSRRCDKGRDNRLYCEAMHFFAVENVAWRRLPGRFAGCGDMRSDHDGSVRDALSGFTPPAQKLNHPDDSAQKETQHAASSPIVLNQSSKWRFSATLHTGPPTACLMSPVAIIAANVQRNDVEYEDAGAEDVLHTDNRARALHGLDLTCKTGVEIGPLNRPIIHRPEFDVLYADHCSTAELRGRYAGDANINVDKIVDVDFDLSKGSLSEQIKDRIDYIVASHVIEHIPDMIGWLKEMRSILNPGGVIALVVPDKRFTFDLHRRLTPYWKLKQAFENKLTRPSLQMVVDHFMSISPVNTAALWENYAYSNETAFVDSDFLSWDPTALIEHWKAGHYVDTHCLVTTPWHFLEVMGLIIAEYSVGLDLQWIEPTIPGSLEFYIQLRCASEGQETTDWRSEASKIKRLSARPELFG